MASLQAELQLCHRVRRCWGPEEIPRFGLTPELSGAVGVRLERVVRHLRRGDAQTFYEES